MFPAENYLFTVNYETTRALPKNIVLVFLLLILNRYSTTDFLVTFSRQNTLYLVERGRAEQNSYQVASMKIFSFVGKNLFNLNGKEWLCMDLCNMYRTVSRLKLKACLSFYLFRILHYTIILQIVPLGCDTLVNGYKQMTLQEIVPEMAISRYFQFLYFW